MPARHGFFISGNRLLCCLALFGAIAFGQTSSSVTLASSPNPANYGQAVTLTATVTPGATGKVTFYDGVTPLGIGTISGGQATTKTMLLQSGTRSLHAYYAGDAAYAASTSAAISQTVAAVASAGFQAPALDSAVYLVQSIAVGDFDGDGHLDVVVAGANGYGVGVLLGKGDGTFEAPAGYLAWSYLSSVSVGDFNGDGKMDLAVGSSYGEYVSVLLGNGDGTFQAPLTYTLSFDPQSIALGDFNGDGKMDLAVANPWGGSVTILLGNGDGTFTAGASYQVSDPDAIAVGDFTGKGKADLAVTNDSHSSTTPGAVSVLVGNGDGTFQAPVTYNTGSVYANGNAVGGGLAIGDFAGNGKLDLAVTYAAGVAVLLGNGDGTFQPAVGYALPGWAGSIAAGDFNGGGVIDLAVTFGYYPSGTVSVLPGKGDGTFGSPVNYTSVTSGGAIAVGDFNGDGKVDLAIVNYWLSVMLGGGSTDLTVIETANAGITEGQQGASYTVAVTNTGFVPSSGTVTVVGTIAAQLTAVSIGGTGWICTLATLTCTRSDSLAYQTSYPPITIQVNASATYTGDVGSTVTLSGGGSVTNVTNYTTFVRYPTTTALTATPNPAVLGHPVTLTATVTPANATGKVTFYSGATVLGVAPLSGAQATFTTPLLPVGTQLLRAVFDENTTYGPSSSAAWTETITAVAANMLQYAGTSAVGGEDQLIAIADFNHDSKPDMVTVNYGGIQASSVSVLLGNGDGTFGAALTQTTGACYLPEAVMVGDFNGDGNPDVAIADDCGVHVLLGNGDGTFQTAILYSTQINVNLLADLNGNGLIDLIGEGSAGIEVLWGNGDGTFQAPVVTYPLSTPYTFLAAVADLNGDGKADLVEHLDSGSYSPVVQLGNGDGTFQAPLNLPVDFVFPLTAVVGDFNGDGIPDLAFAYYDGIVVYPGEGNGMFGAPIQSTIYGLGNCAVTGDFNGDGKLDIAFCVNESNGVEIAFGNGDGTFTNVAWAHVQEWEDSQPIGIAAADLNGDGRTDLVIANSAGGVDVFLAAQFSGLSVSGTHSGNFTTWQTGAYQISITNPTFTGTTGTVTVIDTLPAGLAATSISGSGWTCDLATLTCTRTDALGAGLSYPAITLTVDVPPTLAPSTIDNQASVSYGPFTNTSTDPTAIVVIAPAVAIDTPVAGSTVSGVITVAGWAINNPTVIGTAIGGITVTVDGAVVGNATYGFGRPDVCVTYPGRAGCPNVGYSYQLDTSTLTTGQHTITVSATDTDPTPEAGTASVTITVQPGAGFAQFSDVSSTASYYDAANLMYLAGVTTGCVQSYDPALRQFCPNNDVTREEMAAFIVRAVTGTTTPAIYNTTPYFSDVPATNPFFPHIQKLVDLGVTTGCGGGMYCPTATTPRWEMAMFMIRARLALYGASFSTAATPYFADVPANVEGSGMPFPFIQRSYEEHITNGCGGGDYCPDELVTRGQMASFIMRGLFNETMVLAASAPMLASVSPNAVSQAQGSQITVTITGTNTNFQSGDTISVPSGMLTVGNIVVNSATSITATLTVGSTAVAGPQALAVTTGGQNIALPLAIQVGTY